MGEGGERESKRKGGKERERERHLTYKKLSNGIWISRLVVMYLT